ncbi:MAG: response regulator [Opitutaceae bacterium]|nr:response regulator [Opitutaceae bacterium]
MTQNILTIDDEEVILSLLRELFEKEGYSIAQASTPREAKAAIAAKTPDLIITDLQLANSDGLELVGSIRQDLPDVPVILLTGVYFDEQTIDEKLSTKITAYHNKTAPLEALLKTVRKLLSADESPTASAEDQ